MIVIVHNSQEPASSANLLWLNEFSDVNCSLLQSTVTEISWWRMEKVLSMEFFSQTGKRLSAENLLYLCNVIFCDSNLF